MDLKSASDKIAAAFRGRARAHFVASLVVKIVLVIGGSAVATIAQFTAFEASGPTSWQIAGMIAAVAAGVGGVYIVLSDKDASSELEVARNTVELARESEGLRLETLSEARRLDRDQRRTVELYNAMNQSRGIFEQLLASNLRNDVEIVNLVLKSVGRPLTLAMGFRQRDQWTICVYKARHDAELGRVMLDCVAQRRAIECSLTDARRWPEGVGVSGIAFAKRSEVIVPDLNDPSVGSTYELGTMRKGYDEDRYRSLAAVPVIVERDDVPWGVVIATTDQPHHFSAQARSGFQSGEGVRALAGIVASAVSIARTAPRFSESQLGQAGDPAP